MPEMKDFVLLQGGNKLFIVNYDAAIRDSMM